MWLIGRGPLFRNAGVAFFLAVFSPLSKAESGSVVISQIYGGGGNQGAEFQNDFIELFNRGSDPVDLSGWTVQYASATGSRWQRTELQGTILPGRYYLVQEKQGAGGSLELPTPDATGGIGLSAKSGKVALVRSTELLSGAAPAAEAIVDFVGYGEADFAEGSPAPELDNATAAIRRSGGCQDTGDNAADFFAGAPRPRNSQSPPNPCAAAACPQISAAGIANAASYAGGFVAPGEILVIYGTNLGPASLQTLRLTGGGAFVTKELGGARVLFDGVAAPMIYALEGQVSAVVPFSVESSPATTIQVEYGGCRSNGVSLPVRPSAPGIFTLDASGRGQGAILNQDYAVNGSSAPAEPGSVVMIFATGGGQTQPASKDGEVVPFELRPLTLPVSVRIGGRTAEVIYAGAAPGMVSGVVQVNAKVPEGLPGGAAAVEITIGSERSQPGVTVWVAGSGEAGTGQSVEEKLARLKSEPSVEPLPEIPNDRVGLPQDWLGLISWNIQVGGTSTSAGAPRPPMVGEALAKMFGGTYQILAAQEIPSQGSAELLQSMLPGGPAQWDFFFFDTTDSMDNGFWYRAGVETYGSVPLFVTDRLENGRIVPDSSKAKHPPVVAQFRVGDFDFTAISLHLTFAGGDTEESVRELENVLDYLDWYFNQPGHDPDVIVCGDFNIPSRLSGQTGKNGITLDSVFDGDPRFQEGERRFAVTVHEPTSRTSAAKGGEPANNYDHCVLSADTLEEFIQARRVDPEILTSHPEDPEERLTSDHFPIVVFFRTRGEGVAPDGASPIEPPAALHRRKPTQ